MAIFFTLFGALMIRVNVDDEWDSTVFGVLLICVNCLGFAMVGAKFLHKPFSVVYNWFSKKHSWHKHAGEIKELTPMHDTRSEFIAYFERLAMSKKTEGDKAKIDKAGFVSIEFKDDHWKHWLVDSGAIMEWRNDKGDGPYNQGRVSFNVNLPISDVRSWIINEANEPRPGVKESRRVARTRVDLNLGNEGEQEDDRRIMYTVRPQKWPFSTRDYLTEEFTAVCKYDPTAEMIISRSLFDDTLISRETTKTLNYVRADVRISGYLIRTVLDSNGAAAGTRVTYITGVDLTKNTAALRFGRKNLKKSLKSAVDNLLDHAYRLKNPSFRLKKQRRRSRFLARFNSFGDETSRVWKVVEFFKRISSLEGKSANKAKKETHDSVVEGKIDRTGSTAHLASQFMKKQAKGTPIPRVGSNLNPLQDTDEQGFEMQPIGSDLSSPEEHEGETDNDDDLKKIPGKRGVRKSTAAAAAALILSTTASTASGACSPGYHSSGASTSFPTGVLGEAQKVRLQSSEEVSPEWYEIFKEDFTRSIPSSFSEFGWVEGRVEVNLNRWKSLSAENFDYLNANVVCTELADSLGFNLVDFDVVSGIVKPDKGAKGWLNDHFNCEGSESTLQDCPRAEGRSDSPAGVRCQFKTCSACPAGRYSGSGQSCDDCPLSTYQQNEGKDSCQDCQFGKFTTTLGNKAQSDCDGCSRGEHFDDQVEGKPCSQCEPGTYQSSFGNLECMNCLAGTYAAESGQTICDPCGAGKFREDYSSSPCQDCIIGKYQPSQGKTSCYDCSPGKHTILDGAVSEDNCVGCEEGKYQVKEAEAIFRCEECTAGKYSFEDSVECDECERGKFSLANAATCSNCPTGRYGGTAGLGSVSSCTPCPAGQMQPASGQEECQPCQVGKYSIGVAVWCTDCAAGRYGAAPGLTTDACTDGCASGKFSNAGALACTECSPGRFSSTGSPTSSCEGDCDPGSYAASGQAVCTSCPAGRYSGSRGSTSPDCDSVCSPGRYSLSGSTECSDCAEGYFGDEAGALSPSCSGACPAGKYSLARSTECEMCSPGFYGTGGSTSPECSGQCSAGRFGGEGQITAECSGICETGRYSQSGASICTDCPSGRFGASQGLTSQSCSGECSPGDFSDQGSSGCSQCGIGTYSDEPGTSTCKTCPSKEQPSAFQLGSTSETELVCVTCLCPVGQKCNVIDNAPGEEDYNCALCEAGKYGFIVGTSECTNCESGKVSSAGASACQLCESGWYPNSDQTACSRCEIGKYSVSGDNSCSTCDATKGYVGTISGAATCAYCGPGTFASSSTNKCKPCEPGTFGLGGKDHCDVCPEGQISLAEASSCASCPPGEVKDGQICVKCPPSEAASFGALLCTSCDGEGQYSSEVGSATCSIATAGHRPNQSRDGIEVCPKNTYSVGAKDTCQPCKQGDFSSEGESSCLSCTPGKVFDDTSSLCVDCEVGKHSSTGKEPACQSCDASLGFVAPRKGMSQCEYCGQGEFANSPSSSCELCQPPNFSVGGVGHCTPCPSNQFTDSPGSTACSTCEAGKTVNLGQTGCEVCPEGKKSGSGETCSECQAGFFAMAISCNLCDPGKISSEGSSTCLQCPAGKRSNNERSDCEECPGGTYSGAGSPTCNICDAGTYCSPGSSTMTLCPVGTYSGTGSVGCSMCDADDGYVSSAEGRTECTSCGAGKYANSTSNTCQDCLRASFSTGGTSTCSPCKSNEYNNQLGQSSCRLCEAGKYVNSDNTGCLDCPEGETNSLGDEKCFLCQPGYFAVTNMCSLCDAGKFSGLGFSSCDDCEPGKKSRGERTGCDLCPGGTFSLNSGSSSCVLCDGGQSCPEGSSHQTPCQRGTYSVSGSEGCSPCGLSEYNDLEGQSSCLQCPVNQQGNSDRTGCECKLGFAPIYEDGNLDCVCAAGYTYAGGTCIMCPNGMYKESVGNDGCASCDATAVLGSYSTQSTILEMNSTNLNVVPAPTSRFNCTCEKGDFLKLGKPEKMDETIFTPRHAFCYKCPEGAKCEERGITVQNMPLKVGYWRSDDQSFNVERCYVDEACNNDFSIKAAKGNEAFETDQQCLEGHTGPICNVCMEGFSRSIAGICAPCGALVNIPVKTLSIGAVCFLFVMAVISCIKNRHSEHFNRMARHMNYKSLVMSVRTKFKILVSFYQVVSQYEQILKVRFPRIFEEWMRQISSFVNLDAVKLGSFDCFVHNDFYVKLVAYTIIPIILTILVVLITTVLNLVYKARGLDRSEQLRNFAVEFLLGLAFLIFSSVSTIIFDTFNCSASQIVAAMLLSIVAIVSFVHWRPYMYEEDDDLAIACQLSIFFTIFGALLIRVQVDKDDEYDGETFGKVLIGVNLIAVFLLSTNFFRRPLGYLMRIFNNDHRHTGEGKVIQMGEEKYEDEEFMDYFERLALSSQDESGFTKVKLDSFVWIHWVKEKKALLEWRNSEGNGPINEGRVKFRVRQSIDVIAKWLENEDCELRVSVLQHYQIGPTGKDGKRVRYTARKLHWPHRNRDYLVEEVRRESKMVPCGFIFVGRSIYDDEIFSTKKSNKLGFVRSQMKIKGYMMLPCEDDPEMTEVIFIVNVDMQGWFAHSKLLFGIKWGLKHIVDCILALEDNTKESNALSARNLAAEVILGNNTEPSQYILTDEDFTEMSKARRTLKAISNSFTKVFDSFKVRTSKKELQGHGEEEQGIEMETSNPLQNENNDTPHPFEKSMSTPGINRSRPQLLKSNSVIF
ncbi:hypothetical protein TrVE_jg9591 [Triparma verrucosa]|uniref:SRCR domain-containing protein n=2 Tax=Triparma verrucosa TaxID=1606542 RepID=A0A9W7DP66_9STRA|nr:hypothetical protein TrVE_jg9591 [Triparma verrucosa]